MASDLFDPEHLPQVLHVKVIPKAKLARIKQEKDARGDIIYKIYVTAPPEDGKANQAVIKMLAKAMGIAKSSITITKGQTSREKTLIIE